VNIPQQDPPEIDFLKQSVAILIAKKKWLQGEPGCCGIARGLNSVPLDIEIGIAGFMIWQPSNEARGTITSTTVKPAMALIQEASWDSALRIAWKILRPDDEPWQESYLLRNLFCF
jgi:hypothetical protein